MIANKNKAIEFEKDAPILVMERLCKSYQLGTVELKVLRDIEKARQIQIDRCRPKSDQCGEKPYQAFLAGGHRFACLCGFC